MTSSSSSSSSSPPPMTSLLSVYGLLTSLRLFVVIVVVVVVVGPATSIYLHGTDRSYARYPKWNACVNATLSFEFKTTQRGDALLMYVDDGGTYDFVEVTLHNGRVKLVLNIVDGRDGRVYVEIGDHVNDGRWHRVDVIRNRMETTLIVDGQTDARYAFGSDFLFGHLPNNSHVFFGGLPEYYSRNIYQLALPSALLQPRFRGHIRNVLYGNCTCQTRRAVMIDGQGVDNRPREICEIRDPCRDGCLCISNDTVPACDCSELQCVTGIVTHYQLPMDLVSLNTIINPSGLDAKVMGTTVQLPGVVKDAIRVDGKNNYIQVSGPSHRYECLGDLEKCQLGYTLAFWINFEQPCDGQTVYMSNGGHNPDSHGVAMLYDRGTLQFRFRGKNGREWRVKSDNVLPRRWYHVAASWSRDDGLSLYINGDLADTDISPIVRSSGSRSRDLSENVMMQSFIVGRPNDGGSVRDSCPIALDEFNFWSMLKSPDEIRELGPLYNYDLPMNIIRSDTLMNSNLNVRMRGNPTLEPGKIGNAINLDGRRDYLDAGDQSDTCLGDTSLCVYGITVSSWIKFNELADGMYFLSSGNKGFKLYYDDGRLVGEVQRGNDNWKTDWSGAQTGRWYFVELAWDPENGIRMFVDQQEVAKSTEKRAKEPRQGTSQLYIGRANTQMIRERYANALFDEVQFSYGDRERLEKFGFITRGRPTSHFFNMDSIDGRHLTHPDVNIELYANPRLVPGKVRGAIQFDGNSQYAAFKDQSRSCLGNVDLCRHGILLAAWIKPGTLSDNMEFFSTGANGIRAWYENGNLKVAVRTSTREWEIQTNQFAPNEWQFLEISWEPNKGISLYKNNRLIARSTKQNMRPRDPDDGYWSELEIDKVGFYLGRGEGLNINAKYANMTFDEMEYWYGNRDYLIAFDYLQRGLPRRYHFTMDNISNRKLVHPTMDIPVFGNPRLVPGKIYNAVRLNGNGQYIDLGQHSDTCFGNMTKCTHGHTGSFWINFKRFRNNMYYLSNGNGLRVYYRNGRLTFEVRSEGKSWTVAVPDLETNTWYFMEYSWHPQKGLQVYQNNRLVGQSDAPRSVKTDDWSERNHVYVGRANDNDGRFFFGDAIIDEVVTWFSDRDYLVAFDHILRDDVPHYTLPMETQRGNTIVHPNYVINLYGGATLTQGKIGNAVRFTGNGEYLSIGDQRDSCLGNLEKCEHGLTVSFLMNPQRFIENGYFVSSGPYSVYYKNGKVRAKFSTDDRTWEVATDAIQLNKWQKVELSWDEERGLQMYVDKSLVGSSATPTPNTDGPISDYDVYLGRPNSNTAGYFSDVIMDELEFWYSYRDHLAAFGLLDEDVNHVKFPMEEIKNNVISHSRYKIYVYGGARTVSGSDGRGVLLNGVNQYLDMGRGVLCNGDLEQCPKGFTFRIKVRPNTLKDNTYFVSSAPLDVYYRNGQLVGEVRSGDKRWRTSGGSLDPGAWHTVEVSWHPIDGLAMYVDSKRVAVQPTAADNWDGYDPERRFFIGRADTSMLRERYPNAVIDDVEIWEAKRDYLIGQGLLTREYTPDIYPTHGIVLPGTTERPGHGDGSPDMKPIEDREIVFNGREWIAYDMRQLPDDYFEPGTFEEFHIRFKTKEPTGLLWWSGTDKKNMHISLKDGTKLIFFIDYGTGQTDRVKVESTTFGNLADGQWHDVWIKRRGNQTIVKVDTLELPPLTMRGVASLITKGAVYMAGGPDPNRLTGSIVRKNIYGSIDKAVFSGSSLPEDVDLVDLYWRDPRPDYVIINGNIDLSSPDSGTVIRPGDEGVSFVRKGAYLILPRLDFDRSGTIEFQFRTTEPDGLLMYNGGTPGSRDFVALELYDGQLYFVIDLGDRINRFKFGDENSLDLNDGHPHHVKVERNGQRLRLSIDGVEKEHYIRSRTSRLDLGTYLYLGAVDIPERLPWHLWTNKNKYYQGCLWDVRLNQKEHDLQQYLATQPMHGIDPGCQDMSLKCGSRPCLDGFCHERWGDYYCDCSETSKTGKMCEKRAPIVSFDGSDFVRVNIHPPLKTHTNDISLRFKTHKPSAVLFSTSNREANDYLRVSLENGRGRLDTNLGGQDMVTFFCEKLNDDEWHTLHIKRQAENLKYWVDGCEPRTTNLTGEGFTLDIDQILVASLGRNADPDMDFVGHMQNLYVNGHRFFEYLRDTDLPPGVRIDLSGGTVGDREKEIKYYPVTFRSGTNSYVYVPSLRLDGDMRLKFMFKTKDPNGMLFYNGGDHQDFIMSELVNGNLYFGLDDGSGAQVIRISDRRLNDNEWHSVDIQQSGPQIFRVRIDDGVAVSINRPPSTHSFDISDKLYVGSVPEHMYGTLHPLINSRNGFSGCLATLKVDGKLYALPDEAVSSSRLVVPGCFDASGFCSLTTCKHFGMCKEALNTYICDCNMTAHVGEICTEEPEGYRISEHNQQGIAIFTFDYPDDTEVDKLAFGFMTWQPNGTMIRAESGFSADYIDAKLVNGHVVVTYDIGNGPQTIVEDAQRFNDGQYHYVTFVRRRGDATLRVDDYPQNDVKPGGTATLFNELKYMTIGGELDSEQQIRNYFNGILAGVYLNGYRVIDLGLKGDRQMITRGDIRQAKHYFYLDRPSVPTPAPTPLIPGGGGGTVVPPVEPPGPGEGGDGGEVVVPPGGGEAVPDEPGGGMIWHEGDGGESVLVHPDGVGGTGVGTGGGAGAGAGAAPGVAAARTGAGGVAGAPEGARASVVAGTFLGLLALASGIGWAFYKFKPGVLTAGGGPPASSPLNISSPTAGSGFIKANAAGGAGGMSAIGMSSANGAAATGIGVGMATASTQTPAGMGPAGASAANFQLLTGGAAAGSGIAGVSTARGTVTRPTQTDLFFVPGAPPPAPVAVQSAAAGSGYAGGAAVAGGAGYASNAYGAGYGSSSYAISQHVSSSAMQTGLEEFDAVGGGASSGYGAAGYGSGYASIKTVASAETQTPDLSPISAPSPQSPQLAYDANAQMMNYQSSAAYGAESSSMFSSSYKETSSYSAENAVAQSTAQRARTLSPPPDATLSHSYQMRNMAMLDSTNRTSTGPNIFLAAEEIRVDCLELTADGRYVITGSIFGPPQVWDMRTGELVRVMAGDDLSSTDIHLAAGDSLLVGQVAEMTQVDPRDALATTRVHNRKLQLWDFATGHPLEMGHNEHCTASCMMKDGEKMVLGRTDKYGGGTTLVIWDLLGNEPIRKLKLDASIGFADHISYLNLSHDNRYVVAGFQNSYDGNANFIVFDLTVADYTNLDPVMLALDAEADVTQMLANHEAVTGTRKGELTIWSLRTGKALRQFVSPSGGVHTLTRSGALTTPAHSAEIKAIAISGDGQYLVSASADTTLKVWALQTEKHMFTLRGHTDEVWCCTISHDNDIIASGSRDNTIRLWRMQNGVQICAFNAGVDIFTVKMTSRKKTVVALGDKFGARKLIMLQVVHTKTRSHGGSQTTSPMSSPIPNHY